MSNQHHEYPKCLTRSQWSGTWFGLIKIYTGSDISCHLRSSVSVSDPLKLKSGTWGLFIFIDFLVFIDFFLFFIVNMLKCINFSVYACVGYYFYYELNTICSPNSASYSCPLTIVRNQNIDHNGLEHGLG